MRILNGLLQIIHSKSSVKYCQNLELYKGWPQDEESFLDFLGYSASLGGEDKRGDCLLACSGQGQGSRWKGVSFQSSQCLVIVPFLRCSAPSRVLPLTVSSTLQVFSKCWTEIKFTRMEEIQVTLSTNSDLWHLWIWERGGIKGHRQMLETCKE